MGRKARIEFTERIFRRFAKKGKLIAGIKIVGTET